MNFMKKLLFIVLVICGTVESNCQQSCPLVNYSSLNNLPGGAFKASDIYNLFPSLSDREILFISIFHAVQHGYDLEIDDNPRPIVPGFPTIYRNWLVCDEIFISNDFLDVDFESRSRRVQITISTLIWANPNLGGFLPHKGFRGGHPSLLVFEECGKINITCEGRGRLHMAGVERIITNPCDNPKGIESRNALKLMSCKDMELSQLFITRSAGDGISIDSRIRDSQNITILNISKTASPSCTKLGSGPCENIIVKGCVIDNSWRNGIHVGSGKNIQILSNRIVGNIGIDLYPQGADDDPCPPLPPYPINPPPPVQRGVAPNAGIDIETERFGAELTNIFVWGNDISNNQGYGVEVSFKGIQPTSPPVDITIENNFIHGGNRGMAFSNRNGDDLKGRVDINSGHIFLDGDCDGAERGIFFRPLLEDISMNEGNLDSDTEIEYHIGRSLFIHNANGCNNFSGILLSRGDENLNFFNGICNGGIPAFVEFGNAFGRVFGEATIFDNHEHLARKFRAISISPADPAPCNCHEIWPFNIDLDVYKYNEHCGCGRQFEQETNCPTRFQGYPEGICDNHECGICDGEIISDCEELIVENPDQPFSIVRRKFTAESETYDSYFDINLLCPKLIPCFSFPNETSIMDENGNFPIQVCIDSIYEIPMVLKLNYGEIPYDTLSKYFSNIPSLVEIPAGESCVHTTLNPRIPLLPEQCDSIKIYIENEFIECAFFDVLHIECIEETNFSKLDVNNNSLKSEDPDVLQVFPNPSNGNIFIEPSQKIGDEEHFIEIIGFDGKILASSILNKGQTSSISTDGINSGLYILRILNEEGEIRQVSRIAISK